MSKFLLVASLALPLACVADAQTRYDTYIHVGSTDSLDATYYKPSTSPPPRGYPALLFVHGFGLNKDWDTLNCSLYAGLGYVTLCYSVRGHGNSTGLSTVMSTAEREDLKTVFAFVRSIGGVDTTAIGIIGGSQGGLAGLWAAIDSLAVKAISTDVMVPKWASDMLANGCERRTLSVLLQTGSVHYDAIRDTLWNLLRTDSYDSLKAKFPQARDVDTAKLNASTVPMIRFLKWQDHYFSPENGIESYPGYSGPKNMYMGTGGHYSDVISSENNYQSNLISTWFGYFLKQSGTLPQDPLTYAFSSLPMDTTTGYFTWDHLPLTSWPPSGVQPFRLYLGRDSTILYTPPTFQSDSLLLRNMYNNSWYTFDTAFVEGFQGPRFDAALPRMAIAFSSGPLTSNILWAGVPRMKLYVRPDADRFPLHAQIYEVDSLGTKYFINRINFTARHWQPGKMDSIEAAGIPHAHIFSKGSRIRIELTNIDNTNRRVLGLFPFVIPQFLNSSVEIYRGASLPSFIELPMVGVPASVASPGIQIPVVAQLYQNYPNPFNPSTVIRFHLRESSRVTLKVYSVLGQEVATLISTELWAGEHQVVWNAGGRASGVYFYRLEARAVGSGGADFHEVRKMMLIK